MSLCPSPTLGRPRLGNGTGGSSSRRSSILSTEYIMPSTSSSSSSNSSSPTRAPASASFPPPPPQHYVFAPRKWPTCSITPASTSQALTFVFGWHGRHSTVVVGSVTASTRSAAFELLQHRLDGNTRQLAIVGLLVTDKGKHRNTDGSDDENKDLLLFQSDTSDNTLLLLDSDSDRITIVKYLPPNRTQLQFFSLSPLQLDLNSFTSPLTRSNRRHRHNNDPKSLKRMRTRHAQDEEDKRAELLLSNKLSRLQQLDFSSHKYQDGVGATDLEQVIDWINLAPHLIAKLSPTSPSYRPNIQCPNVVKRTLKPVVNVTGIFARTLISVANWELPFLGGTALKDLSATIQQIDTRLSQGMSWPSQFSLIRQTVTTSANASDMPTLTLGCAHYIQFYNTMWLIANDVIVGSAFTSFVCENSQFLGQSLARIVQKLTMASLRDILLWLNDWPGGVKLNFELASLFCDGFLWGTGLWEQRKKYNVLRKRVEPAVYEVDQLMLGTILFTLVTFLFPTVLVYYLAFAASRLGIVLLHAGLETILAFMNHFPLFAVMLRFKDPARLPGGVQFVTRIKEEQLVLEMSNNPVHLAGIFFQHLQLSRRLASHYSPIYLLQRLFSGRVISPIPRVRLRLDVVDVDKKLEAL
ncbi:pig-Q [Microbotryomycetes sp. JL221]|nr:pig-Q [Microbotryomycetes sp. JL221]